MKRIIVISIISAFIFSLFLAFSIEWLKTTQWQLEIAFDNISSEAYREAMKEAGFASLRNGLLFLAGSLCTIALYALIALKEFKIFQPFMERQKEKRNARKSERLARKEAKTQADKQKRIEELQAELDELNAEEKSNSNS